MSFDFCGTFTGGAVHDDDVSAGMAEVGHGLEGAAEATAHGLEDAAHAVEDGIKEAAEAAAEAATEAANYSLHAMEDFGNQVVDGVQSSIINPMGHAVHDIGNALDDAVHQAEDAARVGLATVAKGAAVVGGAVLDAALTIEDGIENAAEQAASAAMSAAEWLEEVGESALDTIGHTVESAIDEAKKIYDKIEHGLEALAQAFLSLFKDLANFKKALEIKDVLDHMMDYGWRQLKRAIDMMLGLGPAILKEGRDNPKLRGVRAMVVGFQPTVDQYLDMAESALGPLHEDNHAMKLLHQMMESAERIFKDVEDTVLSVLKSFGLETGALEELLSILDPIISLVFGVIGSNPLALDLGDLYDTLVDAMAELGDWLEEWVVVPLETMAHLLIDKVKDAVRGEAYIPGLSELYAVVTLTLTGHARKLSIQEAITVPIAYFIHVTYRVMAGSNLDVQKDVVKGWIDGLPDLPTATNTVRFFEEAIMGTIDLSSVDRLFGNASGSLGPRKFDRLDGLDGGGGRVVKVARGGGEVKVPSIPKPASFAVTMIVSCVEVVALILTAFESLVVTIVGGILMGICTTIRGMVRAADVLSKAETYSKARQGLEITLFGFEFSGLGRGIILSIASAREAKELSKVAVAIMSLIDLVLVAIEKTVALALETLKYAGEKPASSNESFGGGYADASATLLSTVLFVVPPLVQVVDDPVVEAEEAGAAGSASDGIGAVATPLATKATRVLDVLQKVAVGVEVARVLTAMGLAIHDFKENPA